MPAKGQKTRWSKELEEFIIQLHMKEGLTSTQIYDYLVEQKGIRHLSTSAIGTKLFRLRQKGKMLKMDYWTRSGNGKV